MKFKIGDKVKFLNATGGGVISRIIDNSTVHVTIEDGFDIPVMVTDIIRYGNETEKGEKLFNKDTDARSSEKIGYSSIREDIQMGSRVGSFKGKEIDKGIYLSFRPLDQRILTLGNIEVLLVNYTKLQMLLQLYLFDGKLYRYKKQLNVLPYRSTIIEQITREQIDEWLNGVVQLLVQPDSADKLFLPVHTSFKIKGERFYKQDSYINTVLDEYKLLYINLKSVDTFMKTGQSGKSKTALSDKPKAKKESITAQPPLIKRYLKSEGYAEVDLHISELIDDHPSLNPADSLAVQMSFFKKILNSAIEQRVPKMVVIHGVGSGILKAEINKIIEDIENAYAYDAPIRKYGVGATVIAFSYSKND